MKIKTSQYFLILFAVVLGISIILVAFDPVLRILSLSPKGERVNVLVMGMDAVVTSRHTDTIMLLSYSPSEKMLNILSIPRDTLVNYEGKLRRINEIYSVILAKKRKSLDAGATFKSGKFNSILERESAEDFLEVLNSTILKGITEVRYYAQVDYKFFEDLVDNLTGGKVRVEITEPMKYDDFAAGLHINFSTGVHYLNGADALKYVRYRGKRGSDIQRISRQQKFVVEWISSVKKPLVFWRMPSIISSFFKNVKTNISRLALVHLALIEFRDFDTSNVRFFTLPGRFGGNYWIYNPNESDSLKVMLGAAGSIVSGYSIDSVNSVRPLTDNSTSAPSSFEEDTNKVRTFTVEVWNASGVPGAARSVRDILINAGFNVVDWGNYSSVRQEKTLIKNMCDDSSAGAIVRDVLRFGEVVNKYETKRSVDVMIIIGKDCLLP